MPSPGRSALELLSGDGTDKPAWLSNKILPISMAAFGFAMACYVNFGLRKPVFSGIQMHIAFTAIGGITGHFSEKWRSDFFAEKDAVLRHYVELHPELFPTKDRYKYGEILEEWVPIR